MFKRLNVGKRLRGFSFSFFLVLEQHSWSGSIFDVVHVLGLFGLFGGGSSTFVFPSKHHIITRPSIATAATPARTNDLLYCEALVQQSSGGITPPSIYESTRDIRRRPVASNTLRSTPDKSESPGGFPANARNRLGRDKRPRPCRRQLGERPDLP